MTTLSIHINGRLRCVAGLAGDGVVMANVTRATNGKRTRKAEEVLLHVGGFVPAKRSHLVWLNRKLKIGDEVHLKVGRARRSSTPAFTHTPNRKLEERSQKKMVRELAAKFGWTIVE